MPPRRRRDGLIWLVLLALLLALLPIGCIAELALRIVVPDGEPFKDVGSSSSIFAYAPFAEGVSLLPPDPDGPDVKATELARRGAITPVTLPGAVTVVPLAKVAPPPLQIVPPSPTVTQAPTPRPTVTSEILTTSVAGGSLSTPIATEAVVISGATATAAPSAAPTGSPTPVPASQVTSTPIIVVTQLPTVAVPIIATPSAGPPTSGIPTLEVNTRTPTVGAGEATRTPSPTRTATPTVLPLSPTATRMPPALTPPPVGPTATQAPSAPTSTHTPEPSIPELFINTAQVAEGDSGTTVMTFTVGLSEPAPAPVAVRYATRAVSGSAGATPNVDYVQASNILTFGRGEQEKVVAIRVVGDRVAENDETFSVELSGASGAVIVISSATGTIVDDDVPVVVFDGPFTRVPEGGPGSTALVTVTASLLGAIERQVTVPFATRDGDASSTGPEADFNARSGSLVFTPGGSATLPIAVTIVGDDRPEPDEAFLIELLAGAGYALGDPNQATVLIENDDLPLLRVNDVLLTEGRLGQTNTAVFNVSLDSPPFAPVTFSYATSDGSAAASSDYTATSGSLTFAVGGPTTLTIEVPILGDNDDEVDETFTLTLSDVSGAVLADDQGTCTIDDDDGPNVTVTSVIASASEGTPPGAGGTLQFTIQPSAPSPQDVVVRYRVVGTGSDPATPGVDFTPQSAQTIIFPANTPVTPAAITIPIIPDSQVEPDETLLVELRSIQDGFIGTPGSATGTILLDDTLTADLSVSQTSVVEGNPGTNPTVNVSVALSQAPSTAVGVTLAVSGTAESGDYTLAPLTLNFAAGQRTASATLTVIGDAQPENDETVEVNMASASRPYVVFGTGGPGRSPVTVTIVNDDFPTVSLSSASLVEGNLGSSPMVFTLALSQAAPFPVTVGWSTANGVARAPADFVGASGIVTFPAGDATPRTISVSINGDLLIEGDETFQVVLSGQTPAGVTLSGSPATGTILDDESGGVGASKVGRGLDFIPSTSQAGAGWTVTVVNSGTTTVDLEVVDSLAGLYYPVVTYGMPSATVSGGTQTSLNRVGSTITWTGTLSAGGRLDLSVSAVVQLPGLICDQSNLVNPSYQIRVNGTLYPAVIGTAPAPVGDCPTGLARALQQVRAPARTAAELPESPAAPPAPTPTQIATVAASPGPTSTRTLTPLPADSAEPTLVPSATPTPDVSRASTEAPTVTKTPTPDPTATRAPTRTPTKTPTDEPTDEPTATRTPTKTPTLEPADAPVLTKTPTDEPTDEPTATKTPTRTLTDEPTATKTPTRSPTAEPTATKTPTRSPTAEPTAEPTATKTPTDEPTTTRTPTDEPTTTKTPTDEPTATKMPTRTPTSTVEPSPAPAPTSTAEPSPAPAPTSPAEPTPKPCGAPKPCVTPAPPPTIVPKPSGTVEHPPVEPPS